MKNAIKICSSLYLLIALAACASKPAEPDIESVRVGKVEQVIYQQVEKKPALVTVLAGAAIGGLLGNQVGDGSGKAIATGLGAVAGGALTDKALTEKYNQVVYKVFVPKEQARIAIVSGDVSATIFENDIVVIYKKGKKITIDAYGQFSNDKYGLVNQKLADGTLE